MPNIDVDISDNSEAVQEALEAARERALTAVGMQAEGYAKLNCPVDTGRLRNSIAFAVDGDTVYIGTNVEYAPYVEFGTGKYATEGGRSTPWWYQDDKGQWHYTYGSKPHHFLQKAAEDHTAEYQQIFDEYMRNG